MLTKLDIINQMLASTGTSPLTSNDTNHPFYMKAASKLDIVSNSVQARGWWFNRRTHTLRPNTDGEIVIPSTALHADPINTAQHFVIRGRRLFNTANGSFNIGQEVAVNLIDHVALEELPVLALDHIRCRAVHEFYRDAGGSADRQAAYYDERQMSLFALKSEELRNADVNWFAGKSAQALARGVRHNRLPL